MGLNHIYKVIWSKTKNAWVVVSEIAKRDGKSSVKSVVTSLAGRSVAAVMVAMVMCGGVASANTVYGPGATTGTSTNVTVVGDNAQVDNYSNNAVAIGSNATITNGTKSISIGSDSSVDGLFGIAIGAGATLKSDHTYSSSGHEGIVIGHNAKNEYADVVIGKNSSATGGNSTVVGGDSISVGQYSTVIGRSNIEYKSATYATPGTYSNSILGQSNSVMGNYNTVLGQGNIVNSNGSVTASGAAGVERNVVIGYFNHAQGNDNVVLGQGHSFSTSGDRNIVMGVSSGNHGGASAFDTIAIGSRALVSKNNSIAMGNMAEAGLNSDGTNNTSVAIGYRVEAYTDGLTIGSGYSSSNPNSKLIATKRSINLGYGNIGSDNSSVMIGADNTSGATNNSVVIGSKNNGIVKDRSITIGYNNTLRDSTTATDNAQRIVIGTNNKADGENVVVIGNNINADSYAYTRNAIIIGNNSRYSFLDRPSGNITINGINIDSTNFAGNSSTLTYGSYMSVGDNGKERQIKNVAAGKISSSSTDAVNGSQLYEAVRAVTVGANPDVYMHVNDGTSTQGAGSASNNLGKANEKGGATGSNSVAIGTSATATGEKSIAIGMATSATGIGSIRIGDYYPSGVVSSNDYSISIGSKAGSASKEGVSIGHDAIVYNDSENSVAIGSGSRVNAKDSIAIGGNVGYYNTTTTPGVIYKNSTYTGTVGAANSSVAIGKNTQVTSRHTQVLGSYDLQRDSGVMFNKPYGDYITPLTMSGYDNATGMPRTGYMEGTVANSVYLGHESYAFTPNPTYDDAGISSYVDMSYNTKKYDSSGNVVVSNNTTAGAFGKVTKATINGDEITGFAGSQSVGAVTIGAGDYERRIQNVAAGEVSATSTDAINGSQLYAVANTLSKNMSSYMHINDGTSTQTVGNATTNYGYSGSKAGATGTKAIAGGMNAQASGDDAIAMGTWSSAAGEKAVAQGAHSNATDKGAVAIGGSYELSYAVKAENKGAVAIGSISTNIAGNDSLRGSVASGKNSIAILGSTGGENAVAMGTFASATANSSIAIGKKSLSSSAGSIAIGENTRVIDVNTGTINSGSMVAIGKGFSAIGNKSVVIGFNNGNDSASPMVAGNESVILGNQSSVWTNKITSGTMTSIDDIPKGSHIIGNRSTITESKDSVVVGNDSTITNADGSIAIGKKASVEAANSIAIGSGAKASGEKSISIGTGNEVKGNKSSAIGDPSYIDTTATGTHVHGNDNGTATNPIKASESTFMGNTNLAGTAGTTGIHVVGNSNTVDSSNVMVMGNSVNVGTGLDGAVVLGNASSADQYAAATDSTINGVTFEAAGYAGNTGLNKGSIVSVGATGAERQIKNVAAGAVTATSTDAINGSQLYKTAETILKMPINMAGDSGDTVGLELGKTVNIKGSVASGADVTDGNIAVVGDKATSTLSLKMAKNLTGLTSGTFTDATGNQTVINGAGVTVTPTGTGATPISITTSGINAGNQEIKGVKKGTTDDAAVNKKQMDDALAGISSTLTINDGTTDGSVNIKTGKLKVVGESGANALVTTTVSGDTITVGTSTKLQNAVTAAEKSADKDLSNLSATGSDKVKTLAQDAVKVAGTGLATVSDATAAGVKTYTVNVDDGKLVIDDTTGKIGAAGASQGTVQGKDGVATTQNVASVVNSAIDKTKQALDDAKHNFAGDDATVISRKHGEQLNIKGGASTTATDLTSGNIAVVGDTTSGTLNIKMAKALTGLTSATYTDAAGNTQTVTGGSSTIADAAGNSTVVSKGGVTTTDGTNTTTVAPAGVTATDGTNTVKLNGSGIDAGNTEIKHVGKATTDDAAVNKKQMDDALKGATDNTVSLGSESGTTTAKKLSTTGGIKFNIKGETGANALITTSASGDDVTIAPTAKLTAAVTAAEKSADKDLSNLSAAGDTYIKNLAKTAASWNVETNGAGTTAVAGGDTVNFIDGDNIAITNTGRSITIGTAKNVSFDKVTVGGVVIDKNNGIDAGGKEITNVGPATSGNSAVNKTQMDTAITNAVNKATTDAKHDFGGDDATVVTRKHGEKLNIKGGASTTAADLTSGNIAVLGDATTGTLNIRMAKALTGLSSATFTTPSGTTVVNGGGMTITPSTTGAAPISITTGGINAGNTEIKNVAAGTTPNSAVNKQQMDSAISNATANVGFSTAGNTGTGSVSNGQTLSITGTNGIETNASGQSITVGLDAATRAQINNATTTANNAAKKDLSNIDNAGKQVIKDTAAWNVKVNSGTPEIVKGGDTVTFNDGDNIKVTNTGKDITIATKKDVSFDKVTVGNVVIDKNTNRISGLANAANNDEAVNLGQMNAAISTATAGTGNIKYKANGGTQNSVALTTGFDFKGDSNIQITADPANSGVINYKLNPALTGITSISGGTGGPTITLNAGSGSTPGNVSINSNLDMGGKQINNIGAATHAGDAVNKAQMDQALQNIAGASSNAAKSYAYKAGAGAAALAALKPIQYDPLEPTQIMAGIGNYKSQTAVALGVAHYTNENTMFNLGVSLDSHDGIVNAGVTHKFGYSPEKKAIPDKYKGGPISSIYVMQDEVTALQAIVQKQAAENEALRQQNEDMQRKVDMILSKIH
ncbi:MAG: YadA-like family protein [Veillonella sp.]|nr:YadA-like family protein [Veillonella sp.]